MMHTPEELMRSRYEAFIREDWQYIADTSLHQRVEELSESLPITWLKLEVLNAYENIVEFKAYYKLGSSIEVMHEKSTFSKVLNEWKYDSGVLFPAKVQRNESCPCGSGKKYKKCCA